MKSCTKTKVGLSRMNHISDKHIYWSTSQESGLDPRRLKASSVDSAWSASLLSKTQRRRIGRARGFWSASFVSHHSDAEFELIMDSVRRCLFCRNLILWILVGSVRCRNNTDARINTATPNLTLWIQVGVVCLNKTSDAKLDLSFWLALFVDSGRRRLLLKSNPES